MQTLSVQPDAKQHRKRIQVAKAARLRANGHSVREAARLANLHPATVQRLTPEEIQVQRQYILASEVERARLYQERSLRIVETANAAVANATVGTAIDKILALTGDTSIQRHEHIHVNADDLIAFAVSRSQKQTTGHEITDGQ